MSETALGRTRPVALLLTAMALLAALVVGASPADAHGKGRGGHHDAVPRPEETATAVGYGGAVTALDSYATAAGMEVLRRGGNAVDAAIAASAMLGVTRPYDGSIGGGGFFVIYDARRDEVTTIDARETAPAATEPDVFLEDGVETPFPERRVSGLSQGVPGLVAGWELAAERYGRMPLHKLLRPAVEVAERGFVADETYEIRTTANAEIFNRFTSSRDLFLVEGEDAAGAPAFVSPEPGDVVRNPDLADTYRLIARHGTEAFYGGEIAEAIVDTVQSPPLVPGDTGPAVRPGLMELGDLDAYEAKWRDPTRVEYRDFTVFGMGPPSSGGTTVGQALNILENFDLGAMPEADALHLMLEAEALAFADRGRYLGDPDFVPVPVEGLLDQGYADERAALILQPFQAAPRPVPFGVPPGAPAADVIPAGAPAAGGVVGASENDAVPAVVPASTSNTTHLTTTDRWGNVVALTFSIEQIGGSGIAVDGYGFLLNNELTDFSTAVGEANSPDGGKRPRSSIAPTMIFQDGDPFLAYGTPGGATIITTVLQVGLNVMDLGMDLPDAIAAPRLLNANSPTTPAEPEVPAATREVLAAYGHMLVPPTPSPIGDAIGNANGIQFGRHGLLAAAEPVRFGGGSATVLKHWRS
ncbi:gamma-glutamyltransferase [Georgenia subflava]|uniref:Glutathione hydrolase proenzyme n=1 Tax=Georgenia subflava TaxID=1622177 RepID=A0A6N7EH45_9MICO|nr:gamma-glutamyltransferase [Georgenia subflava]MPV37459.1 gamma-glutamyltransferase [Georgenia subflava]